MYFEQLSISTVSMYVPGNGGGDGPRVRFCIRWVYMSSTIGHFPRLIQVLIAIVIHYPSCVYKFVFIRIEMCSKQIYIHT